MLGALVELVVGQFRSRASLVAENEILRQQLAAAKSRLQRKRVRFTGSQRLTIALLTSWTASWRGAGAPGGAPPLVRRAPGGLRPLLRWASPDPGPPPPPPPGPVPARS